MSVAELSSSSPQFVSSAAVVMTIENGISQMPKEQISARPAKGVMVASSSPVLKAKSSSVELDNLVTAAKNDSNADPKLKGIVNSFSELFSQIDDSGFSSLDEKQMGASVKSLLNELISALGGDVPGLSSMIDQLDEVSATSEAEPEETSDTEQFSGTTSSDAKKALAEMAAASLNAQGDTAQVQQTLMEESTVMSEKTLGMITGQCIEQDNNYDQQAENAQKQQKRHRWIRVCTIAACGIAVAAVGAMFGPGAAIVLGGLMAMQLSGAENKMFDNINSPVLKAFAEVSFVVATAVASGGVAGLVDAGFATAVSVAGEEVAEEVGEEAAEQISKSVSDRFMDELSSGFEKSFQNAAIMAGGQAFMSTDLIDMTAMALTDLIFIGHENDNEMKKKIQMALEVVLTIVCAAAMMYAASSLKPSELGIDTLATCGKVLMGASTALQIATSGLEMDSGILQMHMAALQKAQGVIEANLNEDYYLNESNLENMKRTQSTIRSQLKSLQNSLLDTLTQLCDPIKAVAEAISRA